MGNGNLLSIILEVNSILSNRGIIYKTVSFQARDETKEYLQTILDLHNRYIRDKGFLSKTDGESIVLLKELRKDLCIQLRYFENTLIDQHICNIIAQINNQNISFREYLNDISIIQKVLDF